MAVKLTIYQFAKLVGKTPEEIICLLKDNKFLTTRNASDEWHKNCRPGESIISYLERKKLEEILKGTKFETKIKKRI